MPNRIYLDHSATTPLDPAVYEAMKPYFLEEFGNASSIHRYGQKAMAAVDDAREIIAGFLGCKTGEIYFTSGATESDNLVILGVLKPKDHLITTKIEHPAILEPALYLEKMGVEVTYLVPDSNGLITAEQVKSAIKDNTKLVSVMYVNNEIGTIQPIEEIGRLISEVNEGREKKILFHTDAVQAASCLDLDVKKLNVDLMSISGHKIYGPKGIGVLYKRSSVILSPIQFGGHQEAGVRPGTLNVPGIVGLGKAIELLKDNGNELTRIREIRDYLIDEVLAKIPQSQLNGDINQRVPYNAHFSFYGIEGESLLLLLDQKNIAVSTGSACSSGSLEPSHVLMALGLEPLLAHGSLRVSLGKDNTKGQLDFLISVLSEAVSKLRKMSPIK